MNRFCTLLLSLIIVCLLSACTVDDTISHDSICRFTFTEQYHSASQLFVAVKNPGSYAFVWTRGDGKKVVRRVYVLPNTEGAVEEVNNITVAIENNLNYVLGTSNEIGLIIGMTNFNGTRAYDRCCPNCIVQRALQWTGSNRQKVVCGTCQRIYELESGVVSEGAQSADDRPLKRYNCVYNGIAINVWN